MKPDAIQAADLKEGGRLCPLLEDHRPSFVWSPKGERMLWANRAGETLLNQAGSSLKDAAWAADLASLNLPLSGSVRVAELNFPQGSQMGRLHCACRVIPTRAGSAVLVVVLDASTSEALSGEPGASGPNAAPVLQPQSILAGHAGHGPAPIRFTFGTDATLRFTSVSQELSLINGQESESWLGLTWADIADRWNLQGGGAVAQALSSRRTWSGLTVKWQNPSGTSVMCTLSALAIFDHRQAFQGFRGFGLCQLTTSQDNTGPSAQSSLPKIVQLQSKPREALNKLSASEKQAFREIARALGAEINEPSCPDGNGADRLARPPSEPEVPAQPPAPEEVPVEKPSEAPSLPGQEEPPAMPQEGPPATPEELPQVSPHQAPPGRPTMTVPVASNDDLALPASRIAAELRAASELVHTIRQQLALAEDSLAHLPSPGDRGSSAHSPSPVEILDSLPLGVLVIRGERLIFANRSVLDLLGYEDLAGIERAGGLDHLFAGQAMDKKEGDISPGALLTKSDGETLPVEGRLQTISWYGESALMLSVRPFQELVSERDAEAEKRVRLATQRANELQAVLDTATDGVVIVDGEARIVGMNRSAEALFGYEAEHLAGQSLLLLFAPASHRAALDYINSLKTADVASLFQDGRDVMGRVRQGGFVPLFMTMGRLGDRADRFCAVLRDATNFKKAEEELLSAKRKAEQAVLEKVDVLEAVEEEIRPPLTKAITLAEALGQEQFGPLGDDRYKVYAQDIQASNRHVLDLLADLADLSKIEAGKLDLVFTGVNLNQLMRESVAAIQAQAAQERLILRLALAEPLPNVVADEKSVRQILLTLLFQAIKFATRGGQIIISTSLSQEGEAVLRIRDTGVGLTQTEITEALEAFPRRPHPGEEDLAGSKNSMGRDLALPLTKALVEANRASFQIHAANNNGTIMEVVFPSTRVLAE